MSANRCMCPVQQEEEKAWKKIRQTKARATEIVQLRRENEARVLERQLAAEQLSAQQAEIVQRHHREKELQRQARLVRRVERCITVSPLTMRLQRLQEEKEREKQKAALAVKASKAQHKKEVERQRKAEVIKARKAKVAIRVEREAARKRREQKEVRCSCVVECVASGLRSCPFTDSTNDCNETRWRTTVESKRRSSCVWPRKVKCLDWKPWRCN